MKLSVQFNNTMADTLSNKEIKLLNSSKGLVNLLSRPTTSIAKTIKYVEYESEIKKLQSEMIKLQNWVYDNKKRAVILFEGRDAAGKGGAIRRTVEHLNPRRLKVVALPKPTKTQKSQWYFQRYIENLPKEGDMVFFDRSWYNRAVLEPVNKFCSENEYNIFMSQVNKFEKMLIESGFYILKFYFSINKEVQHKRFNEIKNSPIKRWKYTKIDKKAQRLWDEYTYYKDIMFEKTNTKDCPLHIIKANKKIYARTKAIKMILENIPYDKDYRILNKKIKF
ncbi:MAG TPA: polyphosphate kinase 2 [Flavobacteriaceae bacterium]|nr:polyphosphate kinase 2 [Flavobacteriaceae bacterium]